MIRLFSILFALLLPVTAAAQTYDRSFHDWSVFSYKNTCYIGTAPIKQAGNYSHRGQPYVLVVHRGAKDEINVSSGYPFRQGKDVHLSIDTNKFQLFTKNEIAWAYDEATDAAIIRAMKAGNKLSAKGVSQKGTTSDDTYSLTGFTAAYNHMKSKCR
ncbi:MAG: invasion associated locus B family protein [Rickettsiales bacterium]|nr:invasion associated locus B family protein [Rickettsiales bacterium]